MPSYAPSGHLIYALAGSLMAVPFDLERLEVRGEAVPVVQGVLQLAGAGAAQYSLSATGSLAYVSGTPQASRASWCGSAATGRSIPWALRPVLQPAAALARRPAGCRGRHRESAGHAGVALRSHTRHFAPFTFQGLNRHAVWTPDGKRIAFMSNRVHDADLLAAGRWQRRLQRLTNNPRRRRPTFSASPIPGLPMDNR